MRTRCMAEERVRRYANVCWHSGSADGNKRTRNACVASVLDCAALPARCAMTAATPPFTPSLASLLFAALVYSFAVKYRLRRFAVDGLNSFAISAGFAARLATICVRTLSASFYSVRGGRRYRGSRESSSALESCSPTQPHAAHRCACHTPILDMCSPCRARLRTDRTS
jgi:hypothetical protein